MTAGPGETPAGAADAAMVADLTAARGVAEAEVPPELLAQSLRQYLRAWWLRVRSGDSGILPVVLAMAEIFALLLGEIDLSVGLVMAFGSVVVAELVQPSGANWPWWAAIIASLLACSAVGAIQGSLVARLRMPSFIVTLGGLLILEGVAIIFLGGALVS